MNAETTARRVLAWACDATGPADPGNPALPAGPLGETTALARPGAGTVAALQALAARTAGRLGAGAPPFGDPAPVGLGAVLLAAAAGGRGQAAEALALALAVPRADGWADAVARHGVVGPVLAVRPGQHAIGAELADALVTASPLTALLCRPAAGRLAAGTTDAEVTAAVDLLARPRGRRVLSAGLAGWSPDPAVLDWRVELLSRLSLSHRDAVADTYLAARVRHGAQWDTRLRWAEGSLTGLGPIDDLAIATVRFWAPLAALDRRDRGLIRSRAFLEGHRPALRLVERYRLTATAAP